jgi:hypothetical protein
MKAKDCRALRQLDEMKCAACGLAWDVGDKNPPACNPASQSKQVCAYLDRETLVRASKIGGGNISLGVRKAVSAAAVPVKQDPPLDAGKKSYVMLTPETLGKASALGAGNISKGIREAVKQAIAPGDGR